MAETKKNELIRDLTVGSVPKTLLKFAMPLFLSGLLQTVYNMVDMMVVGRFVGPNGLAAVSIGGDLLMMMTFIAMGLSNAGQITISRYIGEERYDRVGRMVGTLFTLLISAAVVMMVLIMCLVFAIPVPAYLYAKKQQTNYKLNYMSGINTGNNNAFVDSFGEEKKLWLSNYYFDRLIKPDKMMACCQLITAAVLIVMLSFILGGVLA